MTLFKQPVRTRFAPSPTGQLHVGGLRTALYNYLFAKQNKGDFIVRIEDTDRKRFIEGSDVALLLLLTGIFNLNYDEGPDLETAIKKSKGGLNIHKHQIGDWGPYIQSDRLDIYQKYAQELIKKEKAYYCFCSSERLEKMRQKQKANKQAPKYDRHCLNLSQTEIKKKIEQNEKYVIRLKVPAGETVFSDIIRGEIKINNVNIDDQVLIKSDGYPTYHLAVVVDDYKMKISHIIRGEEWIPSTPKHIILYNAFGWDLPQYAHLPLLLNPDKSKLSKRQGDVAVEDYLAKGYLPETLLNFVALLGWNPGDDREIFNLKELIKEFNLEKVNKAGAVFNLDKLNWMNSQYIKKTKTDRLLNFYLKPPFTNHLGYIDNFTHDKYDLIKVIDLFKDRLNKLEELTDKAQFLYKIPYYKPDILIFKKSDKAKTVKALTNAIEILKNISPKKSGNDLKNIYDKNREKLGLTRAEMFWPMRTALSGMENSPDVFEIIEVLGREECLKRFASALEKINKL